MPWISAAIRPTGPLVLRGPGEIEAGVWLTHIPLPLPTTVVGALAAAGWASDPGCSQQRDRYEAMLECLGRLTGRPVRAVRGPFLRWGDSWLSWAGGGLVEIDPEGVWDWVKRQKKGEMPGKRAGGSRHRFYSPKSHPGLVGGTPPITVTERVSVSLDRDGKVALEGRLFSAPYVELGGDIRLDILSDGVEEVKVAIRLGGEGRNAVAEVGKGQTLFEWLSSLWRGRRDNRALLLLSTPLLLSSGWAERSGGSVVRGILREIEYSLGGKVRLESKIFSAHPRVRPTLTPFYPGFDERSGRKERVVTSLMPGAVFVGEEVPDWREIYERGAGLHSEVGFGTLIPLPTPESPASVV